MLFFINRTKYVRFVAFRLFVAFNNIRMCLGHVHRIGLTKSSMYTANVLSYRICAMFLIVWFCENNVLRNFGIHSCLYRPISNIYYKYWSEMFSFYDVSLFFISILFAYFMSIYVYELYCNGDRYIMKMHVIANRILNYEFCKYKHK